MEKRWGRPPQKQAVGSLVLQKETASLQVVTDGTPECEVARVELRGPLQVGHAIITCV